MKRPGVSVIEWDGNQHLAVTIDIYCFVFVVEDFNPFELSLYRSYQHGRNGWLRPRDLDFEPRPDLVRQAQHEATAHWHLETFSHGHTPEVSPAYQLFYDPAEEVFDRRDDIIKLVAKLTDHLSRH